MDPICDEFGNRDALRQAMENVEKHYAVVGVVEQFQMSLEVMEKYIPRFFSGARDVHKQMKAMQQFNKNKFKPKVAKWAKDMLRTNFSVEFEFYEFCKQRLLRQYLAVK